MDLLRDYLSAYFAMTSVVIGASTAAANKVGHAAADVALAISDHLGGVK